MTSPRSLSACVRLSVCLCLCDPDAHSRHPLPFTCARRAYQTRCPSAEEVREVVLTHLREKEILDRSLPSSIIIGPFYINVDNVKQSLSKKRKALATSMLDILAKNLHKEVDNVRAPLSGPRACSSTHRASHGKMAPGRVRGSAAVQANGRSWKSLCLNPAGTAPYGVSQGGGAATSFSRLVAT